MPPMYASNLLVAITPQLHTKPCSHHRCYMSSATGSNVSFTCNTS